MDEIDKLLAGIDPQTLNKPPSKPPIEPTNLNFSGSIEVASIDDLLLGLEESVKRDIRQQLSLHPPLKQNNALHPQALLSEIKAEQAEKAQAEQLKQQELELEQQRQAQLKIQRLEQLKAQRRETLRHEAQRWLNQLKPKSEEGKWFEEFACNYESKLEAAIDYLEALQEVNDMLPNR